MGCGSSNQFSVASSEPGIVIRHLKSVDDLTIEDVETAWITANRSASAKPKNAPVVKRTGWKTIRIFVSSTFKDFDSEREILVKKVFPDLRLWCQSRRLHLIECDLRWGVPIDANSETTLRTCLGEIDRCYAENIMPFFVNMTSERMGWVPLGEDLPDAIKSEYKWIEGLSVTEMEIMHGAYRTDNPNALFMVRNPSYLDKVPETHRSYFVDENTSIAPYKLQLLKQMIAQKFKSTSRLEYYDCDYGGLDAFGKPRLKLENKFSETVTKFFQDRIAAQYPIIAAKNVNMYDEIRMQHEAFMKMTAERVVGRDALIDDLMNSYVIPENPPPALIFGGSGIGKTSILSALADRCAFMANSNRLPKPTKSNHWQIFYHFVGAVPGSTDLLAMLRRLLMELKIVTKKSKLPSSLEDAMGLVRSALSKATTKNSILIVDAVNQFDDSQGAPAPVSWLPTQLSPTVRLIVSATPESKQYKLIHDLADEWKLEQIRPLDRITKQKLVTSQLARWNKQLDQGQLELLLNKQSSDNPLWLSLACEELRVFGQFRELTNKIRKLPDSLLEIEEEILARFESEGEATLLVATLCFLEASVRGLLESELLELLAQIHGLPDELINLLDNKSASKEQDINAAPAPKSAKKTSRLPNSVAKQKASATKPSVPEKGALPPRPMSRLVRSSDVPQPEEKVQAVTAPQRLTAKQWADLYRALRLFIRPFGSSGEGRLDFYHRSFSKTVRRRYFSVVKRNSFGVDSVIKQESIVAWFHRILANYFQNRCLDLERRIEEYPRHAYHSGDSTGLIAFLSEWPVFDAMYDVDFSRLLSQSWAFVYDMTMSGSARKAAKRFAAGAETGSIGSEVYGKMEEVYMSALEKLPDSIDPETEEGKGRIERIEKVARVLMQNGRYDAAIRLANRLISISAPASTSDQVGVTQDDGSDEDKTPTPGEEKTHPFELEPGNINSASPEAMLWHAGFIFLKAQIYDEEMRAQDYMFTSHLPKLVTLVDCFERAVSIFDRLAPTDERLGKCLNRVGFHYSGIAMRNGTDKMPKEKAKEMAIKRVEDAIDFYTRLGDQPVNLADCYITRGVCEGSPTQQQIDYYMKGLNLAIEHVGLFHPILDRAYLNVGIFYEDKKQMQDAYAYFRKWYQLLVAVYGPSHPRTLRAIRILNESAYQRLATTNGHTVPNMGLQVVNEDLDEDEDAVAFNAGPAPQLPIDE